MSFGHHPGTALSPIFLIRAHDGMTTSCHANRDALFREINRLNLACPVHVWRWARVGSGIHASNQPVTDWRLEEEFDYE